MSRLEIGDKVKVQTAEDGVIKYPQGEIEEINEENRYPMAWVNFDDSEDDGWYILQIITKV